MIEHLTGPGQRPDEGQATDGRNTLPVVITIAVLGLMAVVIAIDAMSMPMLSIAAIIVLGGVIAGIAMFG